MDRLSIEFLQEAELEAEAAFAWYRKHSPRTALAFAAELRDALARIAIAPRRWRTDIANTRRLGLHGFPYVLIYREGAGVIYIIAVAHTHRRPGYWSER